MDTTLFVASAAADAGSLYSQIATHIKAQLSAGRLAPGDRLPPIRRLAGELGVNRDTVSLAYDLLSREGVVEATVGRGTFVRGQPQGPPVGRSSPPLSPLVDRLLDFEKTRPHYAASNGAAPLHSLIPDPSLYPVEAFTDALNRALARGGSDLLVYGGHQGNPGLREVVAERLASHGMAVDTDNIVPCQGASQGISLAMRL